MNEIGVAVEGPSDLVFWERVLSRQFAGRNCLFRVRSLGGRDRLIREAPNLAEDYRSAHYHSAFFILDADKSPCPSDVLSLFNDDFRKEVTRPTPHDRFAHVCIAFRELESWVLADVACIRNLLACQDYAAPLLDAAPSGKAGLLRLCKKHQSAAAGMEDREFARRAAGWFNPGVAGQHSSSFARFWQRISDRVAQCS